jgi:sugar phosphate isomerase/epimerase
VTDAPREAGGVEVSLVVPQAFPGAAEDELAGIVARVRGRHGLGAFELVWPDDRDAAACLTRELEGTRLVLLAGLPLLRAGATLSGPDGPRQVGVRAVAAVIEQAVDAGAEAVMVTSGPRHVGMPRDEQIAALTDSLVECAALSASAGVRLRLEPTDTDVQHRQLIGPTALALEVVGRVADRGQQVDLNLDLSHLLQLGESPERSLQTAVEHCSHVHLANVVLDPGHALYGDRHPPFGLEGSSVDSAALAAAVGVLVSSGYLAPSRSALIGVEVIPPRRADADETLAAALAEVDAALAAHGLVRSGASGLTRSGGGAAGRAR